MKRSKITLLEHKLQTRKQIFQLRFRNRKMKPNVEYVKIDLGLNISNRVISAPVMLCARLRITCTNYCMK